MARLKAFLFRLIGPIFMVTELNKISIKNVSFKEVTVIWMMPAHRRNNNYKYLKARV